MKQPENNNLIREAIRTGCKDLESKLLLNADKIGTYVRLKGEAIEGDEYKFSVGANLVLTVDKGGSLSVMAKAGFGHREVIHTEDHIVSDPNQTGLGLDNDDLGTPE